jgi:hypothetical protein
VKPQIITIKNAGILNNPINYLNKLYTRQSIQLPVFLFTAFQDSGKKTGTEICHRMYRVEFMGRLLQFHQTG